MEQTVANIEKSIFTIEGMTCQACVKTVTDKILSIPDVSTVDVSLENRNVEILANRKIGIQEVTAVLLSSPKYKVSQYSAQTAPTQLIKTESILKTYKPLITVFSYILLTSVAYQVYQGSFHLHLFMNHIMAGFFLGLSFFKFLDLKAFAESFSSYDPLAQRWLNYGYVYPFAELILGLMFVSQLAVPLANLMTILILTITTIGVYKKLQSKSKFQCACLGATFNLPLSNVTIFENVAMILMAGYSLVTYYIFI